MTPLRPGRLPANAKIGICAPSWRITQEEFSAGCRILQEQGHTLFIHPQCHEAWGQVAGTASARISALQDLLLDDTLDAVFFARGGHRGAELLPLIDWQKFAAAKPKIVMGFSDSSVLLNSITARLGWISVFGPTVQYLNTMAQQNFESVLPIFALLEGHKIDLPVQYNGPFVHGHIMASTLTLLPFLLRDDMLPFFNNAILCIEDCNEELSTIDRQILLLKHYGVFDRIRALVCGSFSNLTDTGRPFGFTLEEIMRHHAGSVPVAFNAPFGHAGPFLPLAIGAKAQLGGNSLSLLDEPFI